METDVVCAALQVAVARRACRRGLLHHSDRGAQYTSDGYQARLRTHGFRRSMSRPGNCYDNAPVESFFRTLKTELGPKTHATRRQAASALDAYIERFYNRERLHSRCAIGVPPRSKRVGRRRYDAIQPVHGIGSTSRSRDEGPWTRDGLRTKDGRRTKHQSTTDLAINWRAEFGEALAPGTVGDKEGRARRLAPHPSVVRN